MAEHSNSSSRPGTSLPGREENRLLEPDLLASAIVKEAVESWRWLRGLAGAATRVLRGAIAPPGWSGDETVKADGSDGTARAANLLEQAALEAAEIEAKAADRAKRLIAEAQAHADQQVALFVQRIREHADLCLGLAETAAGGNVEGPSREALEEAYRAGKQLMSEISVGQREAQGALARLSEASQGEGSTAKLRNGEVVLAEARALAEQIKRTAREEADRLAQEIEEAARERAEELVRTATQGAADIRRRAADEVERILDSANGLR